LRQSAGRQIGGEYLDLTTAPRREVVEKHHRERVGFLPRRAAGDPDAQVPLALLPPARDDHALQELELPRCPEEGRLVGRDAVGHLEAFLTIVLLDDALVVRAEGGEAERAQPLLEPSDEQRLLGGGEVDARLAQDQLLEERELTLGDRADALDSVEKGRRATQGESHGRSPAAAADFGTAEEAASSGVEATSASSPAESTRSVSRIRTNSPPSLPSPCR